MLFFLYVCSLFDMKNWETDRKSSIWSRGDKLTKTKLPSLSYWISTITPEKLYVQVNSKKEVSTEKIKILAKLSADDQIYASFRDLFVPLGLCAIKIYLEFQFNKIIRTYISFLAPNACHSAIIVSVYAFSWLIQIKEKWAKQEMEAKEENKSVCLKVSRKWEMDDGRWKNIYTNFDIYTCGSAKKKKNFNFAVVCRIHLKYKNVRNVSTPSCLHIPRTNITIHIDENSRIQHIAKS